MDLGLRGKVAAVTGGSEGIGRAVAFRLSQEGARVAVCARREEVLARTAREIEAATGNPVLAVRADVCDPGEIERFVEQVIGRFGGIDILVNNAGTGAAAGFEEVDDKAWEADIALKLMAAVRCCRLAIPHMRKRGGGRIINMTTIGGKAPTARALPTSVTRAAGINLTKSLANEYAAEKILVNTVCLGRIKTMQWERRWRARSSPGTLEEFYRDQGRAIPIGRFGEAEEVADLVAFLASERAGYITGTAINIDGGAAAVG